MSDRTPFEYDHHLPCTYEYKTQRNLVTLQVALIDYARHHNDTLPPMRTSSEAIAALQPYLRGKLPWRTRNPATEVPFTPNAALSNEKLGAVSLGGHAIAFYDAQPPVSYRESYYVTLKGAVAHVPVADLPRLLSSQAGR